MFKVELVSVDSTQKPAVTRVEALRWWRWFCGVPAQLTLDVRVSGGIKSPAVKIVGLLTHCVAWF